VVEIVGGTVIDLSAMTKPTFRIGVTLPVWTIYSLRGWNWPSDTFTNAVLGGQFEWTANSAADGRAIVADTNEVKFYMEGAYPRYTLKEFTLGLQEELGQLYGRVPHTLKGADAASEEMMWMLQRSSVSFPGGGGGPPYGKPPYIKGVTGPFRIEVVDVVGAYEQYITEHTVNGTSTWSTNTTDDTGFISYTIYPTNDSEFLKISVTNTGVFPVNSSIYNPPTGGTNWPGGP